MQPVDVYKRQAYTFMKAKGYEIGKSICEDDKVELAKDIMKKAADKGIKFMIPVDNKIADEFKEDCNWKTIDSDNIPAGWMGMDLSLIHI